MREIQPRDSILVPELYLTMKVICTSQQENVAQSLSIHKTSLVTTGKFTASTDGRIPADNPFVGKTGAKEAIPMGTAIHKD
jgi:hypothetical protein